ncbi:MAG: purine-nucleoside phosphorylase [Melioribacteraceae bacterium]|nr:purine-nucleoside phosphorylase [Melioribacteraceae bacterium]
MIDLNFKYKEMLEVLNNEKPFTPHIAIVLGSGLGDFAKKVNIIKSIETNILPNYPSSTVQGHKGYIHFAEYEDKKLLLFQGRIHFYEGYKLSECILPPFIAAELGCQYLFLTNAAGGINPDFQPGDLMLTTSFNAVNLKKELSQLFGVTSLDQKNALLDLPSKSFNEIIKTSSLEENVFLKEGVYFLCKGPSYETPAEVQMIMKFGSDAVGMSTVHEAIYGASRNMKVAAVSCITNLATGISQVKLDHSEVMETADLVKSKFERLVKRIITNCSID